MTVPRSPVSGIAAGGVEHRVVDSPVGALLLAATPVGLVRVAFAVEDHDAVQSALEDRYGAPAASSQGRCDEAARQLEAYFAGRRHRFDLPLDLRPVQGFRCEVVSGLAAIPYGSIESYAQVAARVGRPAAVRAVGSACANNPVPVVVPCHRVVRSDGSLGQYLGGVAAKATLLELEGALPS